MQSAKLRPDPHGRKAKLADSYQELLDEFSSSELKSVGNYTIGRLIGKGSFGKVYLASHKLIHGSKVVLKSAGKGDSNLAREIHHHRRFVHPHIARLYEVIVTETLVWLVLEYCSGDELYNYLLKHGPLSVDKVQKIFAQLVGAVSYVHRQSCVHRDLKLENILFDKHENVKLVDFGFTREYEGRTNHLQTFCGTICYAAPEMLRGEKYAGEKVDVWSLGIILYALLCGELPFDEDDDNRTRTKILTEDPKYPSHLPPDAVPLIKLLLSKRPFPRPSLQDILAHPFLADHAPAQQAILDLKTPTPFSTTLEKECLQRMRGAGLDTEAVTASVLAQRCDVLSGWWTLLLEKEERKLHRRERKRKERESDRSLRRLSAASARLERVAPVLQDVDEEGASTTQFITLGELGLSRGRGRSERRSSLLHSDITISDLPDLPEAHRESGDGSASRDALPPADEATPRSASTSRHRRPIPPPKEGVLRSARSRGSTLHLVTTSSDAAVRGNGTKASEPHGEPVAIGPHGQHKARKKPSHGLMTHWKNWTHWFVENTTRRRKGQHERRTSRSAPKPHSSSDHAVNGDIEAASPRPQTGKGAALVSLGAQATASLPKGVIANSRALRGQSSLPQGAHSTRGAESRSVSLTNASQSKPSRPLAITPHAYKRQSLSPSPLTPRSTVRRSSAGLRGRKSTSSSVSSIRSMPRHHHSHSKASSTSSAASASTNKTPLARGQSPHHSVKVLPATPVATSFPSNIRLVLGSPAPPPLQLYNEGMPGNPPPGSPNPFASGVLFARRKRNLFKGPMLNVGSRSGSGSGPHTRSGSVSGLGCHSGEITIREEDENSAAGEDEFEEVETFSPVVIRPGETIEEHIFEDDGPMAAKSVAAGGDNAQMERSRTASVANGSSAAAKGHAPGGNR